MRNWVWIIAIPHCLNGKYLSQEEYRDNVRLRYGLMPQDIPVTCNGCGNNLLVENALSFPNGGLVLVRHDDTAK